MSINTVEIRAFSGPATVELAGVGVPEIVEVRQGPQGPAGTNGNAATITVGTTTTGNAGTNASVTNSGTSSAAVFNFTIPRGDTGATGAQGPAGPNTVTSATTTTFAADSVLASDGTNVKAIETSSGGAGAADGGKIVLYDNAGNVTGNNIFADESFSSQSFKVRSIDGLYFSDILGSNITANRSVELPDASGTIALTSDIVDSVTSATTSDGTADLSVNTITSNISVNIADNGVDPVVSMTINGFSVGATTLGDGNIYLSKGLGTGSFIQTTNVTSVRTFELPDESGTIALTTSNVATATALQTARTINGVSFNGTANITITVPVSTGITGLGTNVATALAVNVGSAGAFVVNGGALGTPSSGTLTSCTGLPISTGVSGLASGIATFLATPSSANLRSAVTDETGTGSLVFATSPNITTPSFGSNLSVDGTSQFTFVVGSAGPIYFGAFNNFTGNRAGFSMPGVVLQSFSASNQRSGLGGTTSYFALNDPNALLEIRGKANEIQCIVRGHTTQTAALQEWRNSSDGVVARVGGTGVLSLGTGSPNAAAILQADSTTQGFLPPRMTTTERNAITSVPAGLMIYNTTTNKLNFYNGSAWEAVTSA